MLFSTLFINYVGLVMVNSASFRQGLEPPETCYTKECYDAETPCLVPIMVQSFRFLEDKPRTFAAEVQLGCLRDTSGILEAQLADHIKKWMNPAFKPCEDFYEFTCGYWHSPHNNIEHKKHNKSFGDGDNILTHYLKVLVLDETAEKESKLFHVVKQFMTLCLDEESIKAKGVSPAVKYLRKAGGWPVLEKDWSEKGWNFLQAETLGSGVFFNIYPTSTPNISTFEIRPSQIDDPLLQDISMDPYNKDDLLEEYYRLMCDLAEVFGADKNKTQIDMKVILQIKMDLMKFPERYYKQEEWYKLSQLQTDIAWVNWTELLTAQLPESVILPLDQPILVVSPDYFKKLGNFISKYPKRSLANYMMWSAANKMTKYLPINVSNRTDETKSRFDTCVEFVKESSILGIVASYIAKQTEEETRIATEMTQNILNELLIELRDLEWLDEKTRSVAIGRLKNSTLEIAFPEEISNLEILEELFKTVKLNASSFFEAAMESEKWSRQERFRNFEKPIRNEQLDRKIQFGMDQIAFFLLSSDVIAVTAGFLHSMPLFSSKVPLYVNYGHLGTVIAHELIHALDFQTDINDDDGLELQQLVYRWESNKTEEIYEEKKQCIIDQYSSFNDSKYTGQMLRRNKTYREDIADNGGLKLALKAYRRLATQLIDPEPKLPNLQQYSAEQLFMISLANLHCEIPSMESRLDRIKYDSHSLSEFRVKGMMMNSPDFSKLFSCKTSDPLNPNKKCEVW